MGLDVGTRLGRYQIGDKIGSGGMGEVYRAKDTRLGRDVAIKILPEAYRSSGRLRRFEIEARAVAALDHPNIVALYDIGEDGGVPYVVTELLAGETLRARLRGGPLPRAEILRIAHAILDALAAAHDKNIVHRDLKPENVFLCADGRVKLLDFGLAKLVEPTSHPSGDAATAPADTEAGDAMGTPGYMAPEQVRGESSDRRADVFAFGVVLYEMVTGRRAFLRDTVAETAVSVLKDEPPPLDDAALAAVVAVCLEKDRERRIGSARDLRRLLDETRAVRRRPRRSWWPIGAGAALIVCAVVAMFALRGRHRAVRVPGGHHRVAVVGFAGAEADRWRAPLLVAAVEGALAEGDQLEPIDTAELRSDLALVAADGYDRAALDRVHAFTGVDYVVSGAFHVHDDVLSLAVRVQDTTTAETVTVAKSEGPAGDPAAVALAAAMPVRALLDAGPMGPDATLHVRATVPASPEAQQLWGSWQERVGREHVVRPEDRELLEHVIALDSLFAPAHDALLTIYAQVGDTHATAELQTLFSLAGRLGDRERAAAEYRYWREIDPAKALVRSEQRWHAHPACAGCGVTLADEYRELKRWDDCLRTVGEVHVLPASAYLPELDRLEAQCRWRYDAATTRRGSEQEALAAVHRGIARARELGARTELGRLRFVEGTILGESGQISDALPALAEARDLLRAASALVDLEAVLEPSLDLLVRTGQIEAAQRILEEQLAVEKQLGAYDEADALRRRGSLLGKAGRYADGRALLDQAYAAAEARGDTLKGRLIKFHLRRFIIRHEGDLRESLALTTEDLAFNRKARPDQEDFEHAHHAVLLLKDTIDSDRTADEKPLIDEIRPLRIDEDNELELNLQLSKVALDDGRAADAEQLGRAVIAKTEARGLTVELARGRAMVARALLAQGKESDALAMAAEAKGLAERFDSYGERMEVLIAAWLVQGWYSPVLGEPALARLGDDLRAHGDVENLLEAQLALGRVLMHDGKTTEARAQLHQVEKDARARGWLRVARLAAAAAG